MLVAIGLAFVAGLITAISPCVLPVLPIVLAGGASGGRRRPYAIVAGLVVCFLVSILFAVWILDQLGLPQDLLRNISIALLFVVAATLIVPQLGVLIERPLARLSRRPSGDLGGGFLLGCALGFVFVPCGGPAIGFVTSSAASLDFGFKTITVALAYTVGAAAVLLAIAVGGRRASSAVRAGVERFRVAFGIVIAGAAVGLVFDVDTKLQKSLPGWTDFLQSHTEASATGRKAYARGTNVTQRTVAKGEPSLAGLRDFGSAPDFTGISQWLNTPGGEPLTLEKLRGKVLLVDFWTYSCVNCLRTLPHLEAWYRTYHPKGLVIVGVHTPEFAFEHDPGNVRGAVRRLGVRYPVALDNDYGTWNAYGNQYWPAEYLIDKQGHVRHAHFGEGEYGQTEQLIRELLDESTGALPVTRRLTDPTPHDVTTAETYLGYQRLDRYSGSEIVPGREASYRLRGSPPQNNVAFGGRWRVQNERITSGRGAVLRLHFVAKHVYLVLGGSGRVRVLVDGKPVRTIAISGISRLYPLLSFPKVRDAVLELRFTPGISAYAFTFG
jgi:cytochrome c biogenesis protein CcdA/thiol-disulfide isomerase/thioredoxin